MGAPAVLIYAPAVPDRFTLPIGRPGRKAPEKRFAGAVEVRLAPPCRTGEPPEDVEVRVLHNEKCAAATVRACLDLFELAPPRPHGRAVERR